MSGLIAALKRAARAALNKPDDGMAMIAGATVRPYEVANLTLRAQRVDAGQLVARFIGIVKVAASRNSQAVAELPLRVMRPKSRAKSAWQTRAVKRKDWTRAGDIARKAVDQYGDVEEITDPAHPYVRLIREVNQRDNGFSLVEDTCLWLDLAGNAYWFMPGTGAPAALWPLAPQYVHAIPDQQTFIGAYIYGRGTEIERRFEAERMIHFRMPNPLGNPYRGRGSLEACVEEADLGRAFVQFGLSMINNGAQPGMVFTSDQWVTKEQREAARDEFERMYQGRFKAGRSLFMSGNVKAQPWIMGEKEIGFLQSSERVDQVIANCFDMPVSILRLDTAALATAKAAIPQWQIMAISPRARRIEDMINQRLSPLMGDGLFVCFDEAVDRDLDATSTRVVNEWNSGLQTLNEARAALGLDPTDDPGGDEFKPAPAMSKPPAEPTDRGGTNSDKVDEPQLGKRIMVKSAAALLWTHDLESCCHTPPRTAHKDMRRIQGTELQLEAALRAFFTGQQPRIVGSVDDDGSLGIDLTADTQFAQGFEQATASILAALYQEGVRVGISDLAGQAIDHGALNDALTRGAQDFLRRYSGRLIRSVSETTERRIRAALADSVGRGDSVIGMRDAVRDVMHSLSQYGAERIARTESARAYLSAREEAWAQSGVVQGKEWLLSADPCEICQTVAKVYNTANLGESFVGFGETLDLIGGGTFVCDYAAMYGPPAHPNCRCDLGMVLKP